jgi:membrane protease YdiL (CAAX protease family)
MLVACSYSWSLWFLMIASARGWLPFRFPTNPLGSLGPLIAACVLVRSADRAPTLASFLRASVFTRPPARWLLLALIGPLGLTSLAVLAHRLLAGPLPAPLGLERFYLLPGIFVLILLLGGPVGEEFGWRGYVLPLLLRDRSPLRASLYVAVLWVVWHLPLFWLPGAAQEGGSIVGFAATVAAASILFTWVCLHTAPGLLAVLLLHTSVNLWSFVLPSILPGVSASRSFNAALLSLFSLAALAVVWGDRRMRESSLADQPGVGGVLRGG